MNRTIYLSNSRLILLVLTMIFCTDSALVNTNSERIWARLSWIVIIILSVFFLSKAKLGGKRIALLIGFSIPILASMLINDGIYINYIQRIIIIWLGCAIARSVDYHSFMRVFIKTMKLIAIVSLLGIFLKPILIALPLPHMHCGTNTFVNLILTNVSVTSTRNYGPFWEPGAFQLYLNWAIFYEIRYKDAFKIKDLILFVIAIITTHSTGGIMILTLIIVYYVLFCRQNNGIRNNIWPKILTIATAISVVFVFLSKPELSDAFFGKLYALQDNTNEINSDNVSSYTRLYSIHASIDAIKTSPIFGLGITGIKELAMETYGITSNTNSILAFAATFGLLPGILYFLLFVRTTKCIATSIYSAFIIFCILIAMFCTENMIVSLIFWIFLFYESSKYKV